MNESHKTELAYFHELFLPEVETELKSIIDITIKDKHKDIFVPLRDMLAYHMGWSGEGSGIKAQGKRIRPLLTLLCMQSQGADWHTGLPAAASVELIHNFSLIHDDIQDQSDLRHGRLTLWKIWGEAQAINAGDLMFTLAHTGLHKLSNDYPPETVLKISDLLNETCAELTRGQYLDIAFESAVNFSLEAYWQMVSGKTAALLSFCSHLAGILGNCSPEQVSAMSNYGHYLGLAFQAQDDWLGIWGDALVTGKSTNSDLLTRKKTLPVIFAINNGGNAAKKLLDAEISQSDIPLLAQMLRDEGAEQFVLATVEDLSQKALQYLADSHGSGPAYLSLVELTFQLLNRKR